jgi:uncharacterized protein YegP (UPF0339 family)
MAGESDRFEVYQDKAGRWRWKRFASNGRQVGRASQGYATKASCEENMNRAANPTDVWEFYTDKRGEHRWRCTARNGNVIWSASEGYKAKSDAEANAARFGWTG